MIPPRHGARSRDRVVSRPSPSRSPRRALREPKEKKMTEPVGWGAANASLRDFGTYEACLARIERLAPDTPPRWGRMSVAQMLAHCAEVQQVMNGKPLEGTPWLLRLPRPPLPPAGARPPPC